jgi:caffeoyl-CoA O-methyltransferase
MVWIDAEKTEYANYYDLCVDKVRKGGLIMADNVLWSGKVTEDQALLRDKDTLAIDLFNKKIVSDDRVMQVLLPIRDGIMMMIKN